MFNVCCHSVCISEKSYFRLVNTSAKSCFHFKTKISTGALTLVYATNTTRLLGVEIEREMLVFVYVKIHVYVELFFHAF